MAATNPAHHGARAATDSPRPGDEDDAPSRRSPATPSTSENEMMKLGEVSRDYTMATNIKNIFHQMMMSALK